MTEPRGHHIVPRCYLAEFTKASHKNSQLFAVDRSRLASFHTKPKKVAKQRDFHRLSGDGIDPNVFETEMSKFEGQLADVLKRIAEIGAVPTPEEHEYLLNLAALLGVKNQSTREAIRDFTERVSYQVFSLMVQNEDRWNRQLEKMRVAGYIQGKPEISYEAMKDFVTEKQYRMDLSPHYHLGMELHSFEPVLERMFRRHWAFVTASPEAGHFITSDRPVCLVSTDPEYAGPLGFGLSGTAVIFPISKKHAYIGCYEQMPASYSVGKNGAAAINTAVISQAHSQVYAPDSTFLFRFTYMDEPAPGTKLLRELRRIAKARDPEDDNTIPASFWPGAAESEQISARRLGKRF